MGLPKHAVRWRHGGGGNNIGGSIRGGGGGGGGGVGGGDDSGGGALVRVRWSAAAAAAAMVKVVVVESGCGDGRRSGRDDRIRAHSRRACRMPHLFLVLKPRVSLRRCSAMALALGSAQGGVERVGGGDGNGVVRIVVRAAALDMESALT